MDIRKIAKIGGLITGALCASAVVTPIEERIKAKYDTETDQVMNDENVSEMNKKQFQTNKKLAKFGIGMMGSFVVGKIAADVAESWSNIAGFICDTGKRLLPGKK